MRVRVCVHTLRPCAGGFRPRGLDFIFVAGLAAGKTSVVRMSAAGQQDMAKYAGRAQRFQPAQFLSKCSHCLYLLALSACAIECTI